MNTAKNLDYEILDNITTDEQLDDYIRDNYTDEEIADWREVIRSVTPEQKNKNYDKPDNVSYKLGDVYTYHKVKDIKKYSSYEEYKKWFYSVIDDLNYAPTFKKYREGKIQWINECIIGNNVKKFMKKNK